MIINVFHTISSFSLVAHSTAVVVNRAIAWKKLILTFLREKVFQARRWQIKKIFRAPWILFTRIGSKTLHYPKNKIEIKVCCHLQFFLKKNLWFVWHELSMTQFQRLLMFTYVPCVLYKLDLIKTEDLLRSFICVNLWI